MHLYQFFLEIIEVKCVGQSKKRNRIRFFVHKIVEFNKLILFMNKNSDPSLHFPNYNALIENLGKF